VRGQITLRVHDFSKLGPILKGSVEDGITDFRSLSYSLPDEEAAKQKAVSTAMHNAIGRQCRFGSEGTKSWSAAIFQSGCAAVERAFRDETRTP
jgi:hypothetical protein